MESMDTGEEVSMEVPLFGGIQRFGARRPEHHCELEPLETPSIRIGSQKLCGRDYRGR